MLHATPRTAMQEVVNRGGVHSMEARESARGNPARRMSTSDLDDRRPIELAHWVRFTGHTSGNMPALVHHVLSVFDSGTNEQMRGSHTPPVIAFVQHAKAVWDLTMFQKPRQSVGAPISRGGLYFPVSRRIETSGPNPTRPKLRRVRGHGTILVDLRPKACDRLLVHGNLSFCGPRSRSCSSDARALRIVAREAP